MSRRVDPADRERTRQRVLEVAAGEFARRGFEGANINLIAEQAGLGKGTVYLYAESKEQLFLDVLTEVGRRICVAISAGLESSAHLPREQRLVLVARAMTTLAASAPEYMHVQASTLFGVNRRFRPQAVRLLQDALRDLGGLFAQDELEAAGAEATPQMIGLMLLGALQTMPLLAQALDIAVPATPGLAEVFVRIVLDGLSTSDAARSARGEDRRESLEAVFTRKLVSDTEGEYERHGR